MQILFCPFYQSKFSRFAAKARAGGFLFGLGVWTLAVLTGFTALARYSQTPGETGGRVHQWPEGTSLRLNTSGTTLIAFLHPLCPCSRASVEELARVVAEAGSEMLVQAVFVRPAGFAPRWEQSDLWSQAARIPGVQTKVDVEGLEARRFGAMTSGATYLFDSAGDLLFSGGITGSRGHEGDNAGKGAVINAARSGQPASCAPPVFGCSLFD